jgi:tetratricopeptide (TPR) repeat protein
MTDRAREIAEAKRLAWQAVQLGKDDAGALSAGGYVLAFVVGDLDDGAAFADRAFALNPNLAITLFSNGWVCLFLGKLDLAIERFLQAMRLSPLDPLMFSLEAGIALAHLLAGRYEEATSWAEKSLRDLPDHHASLRILAASHALAGRLLEAKEAMGRMRELDPNLRVSGLKQLAHFRRAEDFARWAEGLRKAGLPE